MKIKDIRGKSTIELQKDLTEKRKKLQNLRFELTTKNLKNHREVRLTKKEVAQILTVLSEKKFLSKEEEKE